MSIASIEFAVNTLRQRDNDLYSLGFFCKEAAEANKSYSLSGRLYVSDDGWVLLSVPNALVRGAFDAIHEPGIELPPGHAGKIRLNAHASVMRPDEVKSLGGAEKITERGHQFHYTISGLKVVEPSGWEDISKCWYLEIKSPELEQLRKSYGLSARPNNNKFEFHITVAVRRKHVLRENDVKKASNELLEPLLPDVVKKAGVKNDARYEALPSVVSIPSRGGSKSICPRCGKNIEHELYTDRKGWTFHRSCFSKGMGRIKRAAEFDPFEPQPTSLQANLGALGVASGVGVGAAGVTGRLVADPLGKVLQRYAPIDLGLDERLKNYVAGEAATVGTHGKQMTEYIRGGHDVMSNKTIGNDTGFNALKKFQATPLGKTIFGDNWAQKEEHFDAFRRSPLAAHKQMIREMYWQNTDDLFRPQADAVQKQIDDILRRKNFKGDFKSDWAKDPVLRSRIQPLWDQFDSRKARLIANAQRVGVAIEAPVNIAFNDMWRTVKQTNPKLFARLTAAGVRSPSDFYKNLDTLPKELQHELISTFTSRSELGKQIARKFTQIWKRSHAGFANQANLARYVTRPLTALHQTVLPAMKRYSLPIGAAGLLGLGGLGSYHWRRGNQDVIQQKQDRYQRMVNSIADEVRTRQITEAAQRAPAPTFFGKWYDQVRNWMGGNKTASYLPYNVAELNKIPNKPEATAAFAEYPIKPSLLLRLQNPYTAAAARKEFDALYGHPTTINLDDPTRPMLPQAVRTAAKIKENLPQQRSRMT